MRPSLRHTILIVDDDRTIRENLCGFFKETGWDVLEAAGGKAALRFLRLRKWECDCIILDQRMREMNGLTFLKMLRQQEGGAAPIPVIVLSAYVNSDADRAEFMAHGTERVFQKPQGTFLLGDVARAITTSITPEERQGAIERAISAHELDERVRHHEDLINDYYRARILEQDAAYQGLTEPLFVVARRWNSWYPSFFDVPGGAYALVFPKSSESKRNRVAVVDPGFRFLKVLSDLGVSVQDLDACIITHNHPDHMGGVFEFIACRYKADKPSEFLCNSSTHRMLSQLSQANVTPRMLPDKGKEDVVFSYKDSRGAVRSLGVRTFATDHREVGWDSDSRGVVLTAYRGNSANPQESASQIIILGDSAFDEANPEMDYPKTLAGDESTKIVVLHIGSAQMKQRTGGHLYLTGLGRLVLQVAAKLEKQGRSRSNRLVILVSEWGLEHANANQMKKICPETVGFHDVSAMVSTIEFLRNNLRELGYNRLTVLPADIGLAVGMTSGQVYLRTPAGRFEKVPAEKVAFASTTDGLKYSRLK
jgi:CheY-like chemotaxis protein